MLTAERSLKSRQKKRRFILADWPYFFLQNCLILFFSILTLQDFNLGILTEIIPEIYRLRLLETKCDLPAES